uniref:Ion_trans_2 domain-containing protein n=1 Tax=Heterorhabditis bacteriophora TaxID=37862 RepID=A0A1I7XFJ1_HETBA
MDTSKSLTGVAQLMLPALIEREDRGDERNRTQGNRLLQIAHTQIRRGAAGVKDIAGRAHSAGKRQVERFQAKPPLCFIILNRAYHKYGLKHLVLILVFLFYTAFGAFVFLVIEGPYQNDLKQQWTERISLNRSRRVNELMIRVFNNSDYLIYVKGITTERLRFVLNDTVGLGDLVPSSPRLLITMFGFILVGLSLVSMVINLLQLKCFDDPEEKKSLSEQSLSRSTQTSLSLPVVKQVVLRSDGVHWITGDSPIKSPDEVTRLVEMESGLRVCEQIGDNNEDDDNADNLLEETNVLLEKEEEYN